MEQTVDPPVATCRKCSHRFAIGELLRRCVAARPSTTIAMYECWCHAESTVRFENEAVVQGFVSIVDGTFRDVTTHGVDGLSITPDPASLRIRHGAVEVSLSWFGDDQVAWSGAALPGSIRRWSIDTTGWPRPTPVPHAELDNFVRQCPSGRFAVIVYAVEEHGMGWGFGTLAIVTGPPKSPTLYATLFSTRCLIAQLGIEWLADAGTKAIFAAHVWGPSVAGHTIELALFDVFQRSMAIVQIEGASSMEISSGTDQQFVLKSGEIETTVAYGELHWIPWTEWRPNQDGSP